MLKEILNQTTKPISTMEDLLEPGAEIDILRDKIKKQQIYEFCQNEIDKQIKYFLKKFQGDKEHSDDLILDALAFLITIFQKTRGVTLWDNQLGFIITACLDKSASIFEGLNFNPRLKGSRFLELPAGEGKTFCNIIIVAFSMLQTNEPVAILTRDDSNTRVLMKEMGKFIDKLFHTKVRGVSRRAAKDGQPICWKYYEPKADLIEKTGLKTKQETYTHNKNEPPPVCILSHDTYGLDITHDTRLFMEQSQVFGIKKFFGTRIIMEVDLIFETPPCIISDLFPFDGMLNFKSLFPSKNFPNINQLPKNEQQEMLRQIIKRVIEYMIKNKDIVDPEDAIAKILRVLLIDCFIQKEMDVGSQKPKFEIIYKEKGDLYLQLANNWLIEHPFIVNPIIEVARLIPGVNFLDEREVDNEVGGNKNKIKYPILLNNGMPNPYTHFNGVIGLFTKFLVNPDELSVEEEKLIWQITTHANRRLLADMIFEGGKVIGMSATLPSRAISDWLGIPSIQFPSHEESLSLIPPGIGETRVQLQNKNETVFDYVLSPNPKRSLKMIEQAIKQANNKMPFLIICDSVDEAQLVASSLKLLRTTHVVTALEEYKKPGFASTIAGLLKPGEILVSTQLVAREVDVPINGVGVIILAQPSTLTELHQMLLRTIRGDRREGLRLLVLDQALVGVVAESLTNLTFSPYMLAPDPKNRQELAERQRRREVSNAFRDELFRQIIRSQPPVDSDNGQSITPIRNRPFLSMLLNYLKLLEEAKSRSLIMTLSSEKILQNLKLEFEQKIQNVIDKAETKISTIHLFSQNELYQTINDWWYAFEQFYLAQFQNFSTGLYLQGKGDMKYMMDLWFIEATKIFRLRFEEDLIKRDWM